MPGLLALVQARSRKAWPIRRLREPIGSLLHFWEALDGQETCEERTGKGGSSLRRGLDANGKPRGARFTIPTICKPLSPLSAMDRAPSKNKGKLFLWG
jgi:hypothetical protein